MIEENNELRYNSYSRYLIKKFGCRVKKICIDGGFTCPNKDGTKGINGCIFCNEKSYTPHFSIKDDIVKSIEKQITGVNNKYIVYFQTNTSTYSDKNDLMEKYDLALNASPLITGLKIGTRSDCLSDQVLELIVEYARRTYLTIDIGIESIYDKTLEIINRGHDYDSIIEALNTLDNLKKTHQVNFDICGHIIIGFPWETYDEQMAYADEINKLPVNHLKINNLQVIADTKLFDMYKKEPFQLYSHDEYAEFIANFLSYLSPDIVIQRLVAYCPADFLIYPKWAKKKFDFYKQLNAAMQKNNLYQGSRK